MKQAPNPLNVVFPCHECACTSVMDVKDGAVTCSLLNSADHSCNVRFDAFDCYSSSHILSSHHWRLSTNRQLLGPQEGNLISWPALYHARAIYACRKCYVECAGALRRPLTSRPSTQSRQPSEEQSPSHPRHRPPSLRRGGVRWHCPGQV